MPSIGRSPQERSWLAFPPAHHREYSWPSSPHCKINDGAARLPPQSISLKYAAPGPHPRIASGLAAEPAAATEMARHKWLFRSQWKPQPESLPGSRSSRLSGLRVFPQPGHTVHTVSGKFHRKSRSLCSGPCLAS